MQRICAFSIYNSQLTLQMPDLLSFWLTTKVALPAYTWLMSLFFETIQDLHNTQQPDKEIIIVLLFQACLCIRKGPVNQLIGGGYFREIKLGEP